MGKKRLGPYKTESFPSDFSANGVGWTRFPADSDQELHLELGCADGIFVEGLKRWRPNSHVLGIEKDGLYARKGMRRLQREKLDDAWIMSADARQVLTAAMSELQGTFHHAWLNFPDPWPKDRHAKHRLSEESVLRLIAGVLVSGGELHLATDSAEFAQDFTIAAKEIGFREGETQLKRVDAPVVTRYQQKWIELGRELHFLDFTAPEEKSVFVDVAPTLASHNELDDALQSIVPEAGTATVEDDDWLLKRVGRRQISGGREISRFMLVDRLCGFADRIDIAFDDNEWTNRTAMVATREKVEAVTRLLPLLRT